MSTRDDLASGPRQLVPSLQVSATLQAWAMHPVRVKGGSPSKISAIERIP
jgi:hypothetical protein